MQHPIYDCSVLTIDGQATDLSMYRNHVIMIVNIASNCGLAPTYASLETLYQRHKDRQFVVLGFPCNQFGKQEPGDEAQIAKFCKTNYDVHFPLFSKIMVNGTNTHPLFAYLKNNRPGFLGEQRIHWNFTKFVINREGDIVDRIAPLVSNIKTLERRILRHL